MHKTGSWVTSIDVNDECIKVTISNVQTEAERTIVEHFENYLEDDEAVGEAMTWLRDNFDQV